MTENEFPQMQASYEASEQVHQPTTEILDPNPLDLTQQPIETDRIFDIRFKGEGALRVMTTVAVPNMVYIYDGEIQVARVSLTADGRQIQDLQLAIEPQRAAHIISMNPELPYKEQIRKLLDRSKPTKLDRTDFEFDLSQETIDEVESLFKNVFQERVLFVPPNLIRTFLRDVPADVPANGLYIPQLIGEEPNPMREEYHRRALGWLLGNGVDVDRAIKIANRLVYKDYLMISSDIGGEDADEETKRLVFHESLHVFISLLRQSQNKEVQDIARKMMSAYINIEPSERLQADMHLTKLGYTPIQRPEEFWTHYLADKAYPAKTGIRLVETITQLSSHPNIQQVTNLMQFLVNSEDIHELVEGALEKAEEIGLKARE